MHLQSDLRLVASNAKLFNPPGTIYHTEADRIQAWGLDHIAKAAPTVIQYETDWNIEIENDDDGTVNIDDDEFLVTTPMDIGEAGQTRRSPSVASQIPQSTGRRLTRGPYKKATSNTVTESVDAEGRLPGSKDGLGSFPPGSDWAQTMLALKLKGIVFVKQSLKARTLIVLKESVINLRRKGFVSKRRARQCIKMEA
jgi:bromodomain-containing protein 7/9